MNNFEFKLLDNNCITRAGSLLEWLKSKSSRCTNLNIASAFFYNLIDEKSRELDLFRYLIKNNPLIKINLIISNRLTTDIKEILKAWIKNEDLSEAIHKDQELLSVLNQLKIKIFTILKDKDLESRFFHPKLYILQKDKIPIGFFLGSGNLTPAGLSKNIELMLYETEPNRCKEFQEWFEKLISIAEPITLEILNKIKSLPKTDKELSCELDKSEKTQIEFIKLGEEIPNIDFEIKENNIIILKGIVIYDYETGQPISIEMRNIIAWCIGRINETEQFNHIQFKKIADDKNIEYFFEKYESNTKWIHILKKKIKEVERSQEIEINNLIEDSIAQILTNEGKLFQEKLKSIINNSSLG